MTTLSAIGLDIDPIWHARFDAKYVVSASGCWEWTAFRHANGYGQFKSPISNMAHRFSWIRTNGFVPEGLDLDHLCRVRHCVNPEHLEAVTRSENLRRGSGPVINRERAVARTHCKHGHELTEANLLPNNRGIRLCRQCRRIRDHARKR